MRVEPAGLTLRVLAHVCAVGVAAYFIYAAEGKVADPRQFAVDIGNYRIIPAPLQNLIAIFMPWWEIGAVLALVIPQSRRAGAVIVSALLIIFIAAVAYAALYKGLDISCGCTGKESSKAGWLTILRNLGLLLATWASVYLPALRRNLEATPIPVMASSRR